MYKVEFPSKLNTVQVGDDAPSAIGFTLEIATDLHDEIQALAEAAEADRDLKTTAIALKVQKSTQKLISKCEALQAQIDLIGHAQWLGHKTGKL